MNTTESFPQNAVSRFYFRHRGLCLAVIALAVTLIFFRAPNAAQAASDPETTDLIKSINEIILLIMRLSSAWLWPVLLMIGSLLDNDLVFGGAMGERLLSVWVQIRNLVNVIFVLILLAIAVYNVLGLGEEGGGLPLAFKTVMPKFVLALIAVNFSFLAAKVVLDFTNVITGAVFALPTNITDTTTFRTDFEEMICGTSSTEVPMKPLWCDGKKLNDRAVNFFSRLDRSNITLAYAVQFGRAPNLKFIKDGLKDLGQLGFNIIFNTVLYVVYALSFIALLLVLLFRVVALWVGVVLSPLIALSIVLPNLKELAGGAGELKDQFVKNAIAPIKIGLVLSVGYIMLNGFSADKSIHGELLSSSTLGAVDPNALPTDITDLQQLMIAVGVIVIVWMGVFSAADETAAKSITGFVRDKAQTFGKFAAKLPTFAQIIPTGGKVPGQPMASFAEIGKTLEHIPSLVERKYGSSLFEHPASVEDLSGIRGATSPQDLAKAIAQSPHVLNTLDGWDSLKKKMVELPEMGMKTVDDFHKRFGEKYDGQTAQRLWNDPKFGQELRRAGFTSQDDLREKIERKPASGGEKPAPVTDAASAKAALESQRSGDALKKEESAAFKQWSTRQIDIYKELPSAIKEALGLVWKDNQATINFQLLDKIVQLKDLDKEQNPAQTSITFILADLPDAVLKDMKDALSNQVIKTAIDTKMKKP